MKRLILALLLSCSAAYADSYNMTPQTIKELGGTPINYDAKPNVLRISKCTGALKRYYCVTRSFTDGFSMLVVTTKKGADTEIKGFIESAQSDSDNGIWKVYREGKLTWPQVGPKDARTWMD